MAARENLAIVGAKRERGKSERKFRHLFIEDPNVPAGSHFEIDVSSLSVIIFCRDPHKESLLHT